MNAQRLVHPWQPAAGWKGPRRRRDVAVVPACDTVRRPREWGRWSGGLATTVHRVFTIPPPHTLPDHRSHYYPSRCGYLESSELSRLMDHL
jgi:hypothetical protein